MLARVGDDGGGDVRARQHRRRRAELLGELDGAQDALATLLRQPLQRRRLDVDGVPRHRELLGEQRRAAHDVLAALARADAAEHAPLPSSRPGRSSDRRGRPARRPRRGRRCGAAPARAAPSGCPCGRSSRPRARPAPRRRPCRPSGARSARRPACRPARPRRRGRRRCRARSPATRTPVMPPTTSLRLSRCWTLSVVQTSMPAASSSSTSCQRFGWREPATLECASSSTRISAGRRASAASRSNSASVAAPAPAIDRRGRISSPCSCAAVSAAAVRLDDAGEHVDACGPGGARGGEHRVGLADAGRRAEVDAQPAACGARLVVADALDQRVGIRTGGAAHLTATSRGESATRRRCRRRR